jgi:hypothetical protein
MRVVSFLYRRTYEGVTAGSEFIVTASRRFSDHLPKRLSMRVRRLLHCVEQLIWLPQVTIGYQGLPKPAEGGSFSYRH